MDSDTLHIIYASDQNCALMLGVSIVSLLVNNADLQIKLHILDSGIDYIEKTKIDDICHT